jgi:hypothetical protein
MAGEDGAWGAAYCSEEARNCKGESGCVTREESQDSETLTGGKYGKGWMDDNKLPLDNRKPAASSNLSLPVPKLTQQTPLFFR